MSATKESIETLAINTIRTLAMDAVQAANSGHPGAPMGLAPTGYVLWQQFLRSRPGQSRLAFNRDRFVLSNGHASDAALLAAAFGRRSKTSMRTGQPTSKLAVTLDNIKRFRQLDSPCAGHRKYHHCTRRGSDHRILWAKAAKANSVGIAIARNRWIWRRTITGRI